MKIHARAEIHFHEQDEVSVFLETSVSPDEELYTELGLFACFALRQLSNLSGRSTAPVAASLAEFLSGVDVPSLDEFNRTGNPDGVPRLVAYPGHQGRKSFVATVRGDENAVSFDLRLHGFGFLARGAGCYAPTSVLLLLRYLSGRRKNDDLFLGRLAAVAKSCGDAYMKGDVSLGSTSLAVSIVADAWQSRQQREYPIDRAEWTIVVTKMFMGAAKARRDFNYLCLRKFKIAEGDVTTLSAVATGYQLGMILPLVSLGPYIHESDRQDFIDEVMTAFCTIEGDSYSCFNKYWKALYEGRAPATMGEKPSRLFVKDVVDIVGGDQLLDGMFGMSFLELCLSADTQIETYKALGDYVRATDQARKNDAAKRAFAAQSGAASDE